MRIPPKDWTVLVYAAGANDLSSHIDRRVQELSESPPPDNVQIVMRQFDDQNRVEDIVVGGERSNPGPIKCGESSSLNSFLVESMARFPSRHYLLVVSSHGEGHAGVAIDTVNDDRLDLGELEEAIGSNFVDVVFFDACLMASAEVVTQLEGQTGIVIGSEDVVRTGLDWKVLSEAASRSESPEDFARQLVAHPDGALNSCFRTLGAFDTQASKTLEAPLGRLARAILEARPEQLERLREISEQSRRAYQAKGNVLMGYLQYQGPRVDLGAFAARLVADGDPNFAPAARKIQQALEQTVLAFRAEPDDPATGLSLYLPVAREPGAVLFDPVIRLARETGWEEAAQLLAVEDTDAAQGPSFTDLLSSR